jgi:hypothetical protein
MDFVITMEEGLVWAIAPTQSPPPTGLDTIIEALEELQLNALEAYAPGRDQFLNFDFGMLEHQLAVYLRTPSILGGPMGSHLLLHQHHDVAH